MMKLLAVLFTLSLVVTLGSCSNFHLRHLLQGDDGWIEGRATWYSHPHTGSCGYGHLDDYQFGEDAVAAFPDSLPDYPGSCGRCFQVKCRGIQAISSDGAINLDRYSACKDTDTSIVIKVVDTCPKVGNEQWCSGDMFHLDLSQSTFARLAEPGVGIIGLYVRPVPCETVNGGNASPQDWQNMETAIEQGASPQVFTGNGVIGIGWAKTVYGDANKAMYTYNDSIEKQGDGDMALCGTFEQYGGFDFHSSKDTITMFTNTKAVEFWAKSSSQWPDMSFRISNRMTGSCQKDVKLSDGATQDVVDGFTRFYFDYSVFDCSGAVQLANLNRLQWESKQGGADLCVKDVRLVGQDEAPVASAGK